MARIRRFLPRFATDVRESAAYYDEISPGIGNSFRAAVQEQIEIVMSEPDGFAKVHKEVRAKRVRRFPWVLLYESYEDHVLFVALVHGAMERRHWFDRVE